MRFEYPLPSLLRSRLPIPGKLITGKLIDGPLKKMAQWCDLIKFRIRETRADDRFIYFYLKRGNPRLVLKISKRNIGALLDWLEDQTVTHFNQGVVKYVWRQLHP